MKSSRRTKLLLNHRVQKALLLQSLLHWGVIGSAIFCVTLAIEVLGSARPLTASEHFSNMANRYGPALLVFFCLAPAILWDSVRLSHRFVGPIVRLANALRSAAQNEAVAPIKFRKNDFWNEIADDANVLLERGGQLQESNSPAGNS